MKIYDIYLPTRTSRGNAVPTLKNLDDGDKWFIRTWQGSGYRCTIEMSGYQMITIDWDWLWWGKPSEKDLQNVKAIIERSVGFIKTRPCPEWAGGPKIGNYGP